MGRLVLTVVLAVHGLIHLAGFIKAFDLAELKELKLPVSKAAGTGWFLGACLFLAALCMYLLGNIYWWLPTLPALLLSQFLIIKSWRDARAGTLANLLILPPAIIAMAMSLPGNYNRVYRQEVSLRLKPAEEAQVLTRSDISQLPRPIRRYLQFCGAVGRPRVNNFKAVLQGRLKQSPEGRFLPIRSEQYNFMLIPSRLFYINADMLKIPFEGLHLYRDGEATFQVRIAGLIQVVDAAGPRMDQAETVTVLNDMCLLAPATLISERIEWTRKNLNQCGVRLTIGTNSVYADLYFAEDGSLTNFISYDRWYSTDGKIYEKYPWSTPVDSYREVKGRKIPASGKAVWHMPQGDFTYIILDGVEVDYNRTINDF